MGVRYYNVNASLKGEDQKLRHKLGGITFYTDIRGRSPWDRIEFITVPLNEWNRNVLKKNKVLFNSLLELSIKFSAPLILFVIFHKEVAYRIYVPKKPLEESYAALTPIRQFFKSLQDRKSLLEGLSFPRKCISRIPSETECSMIAYSYYHNLLPEDCWCVDVDCFNGDFWEVKRKGESLTYNQLVLKRLVEEKGYVYRILEV